MKAEPIVLGITSDSFWFIGLYLIILGVLMGIMFYELINKKNQNVLHLVITIISLLIYFIGGIISGLVLGVHFYVDDSYKLGSFLAGVPGIVGTISSLTSFSILAFSCKQMVNSASRDPKVMIEGYFSKNSTYVFSQLTLIIGLIFTTLAASAIIDLLLNIPDDNKIHLIGLLAFIPFILLFYLLIKIPKWFEKSVWIYAINQQLVQDYPDRLKKNRGRNK